MLRNVKHQLNHSKVALCKGLRGVMWLGYRCGVGLRGVVGVGLVAWVGMACGCWVYEVLCG